MVKRLLVLFILIVGFVYCPQIVQAADIVITEIMYNPVGSDTGNEWLEIKNISSSTINILDGNWRFNDGSSHLLATSSSETLLLPETYAVIADDPSKFKINYPGYTGIIFDSSFTLKNSNNKIALYYNGAEDSFVNYDISLGGNDDGKTLEYDWLTNSWRVSYVAGGTPGQLESTKPANSPPTLQVNLPAEAYINREVDFSCVVADVDGDVVNVNWDFGDGSAANEAVVKHVYGSDGVYTVVTTASDGELSVNVTSTIKIIEETVVNSSPIVKINGWPKVEISELMPNPLGSDVDNEWIELYNNSPDQVSVDRWQIGDESSRRFTIKSEKTDTYINAYGFLLIKKPTSGISLNNSGEQVVLYAPDGTAIEKVTYDKANDDWSFAKSDGAWQWTTMPTPGKINIIESSTINAYEEEMVSPSSTSTAKVIPSNIALPLKTSSIVIDENVPSSVILSEVFPNPAGKDDNEWLELKNISSTTINLLGYYIDDIDGGSKPYYFSTSTLVMSQQYLVLNKVQTKLILGNQSDSVRLLDNNKNLIWEVKYEQAKENNSYAYNVEEDDWQWTNILTAGRDNLFASNEMLISVERDEFNNSFQDNIQVQEINEIINLPDKTMVLTEGVVVAPFGLFSKNILYLADYNLNDNIIDPQTIIQIYTTKNNFDEIKIGDVVQVIGELATSKNERRLKIRSGEVPVVVSKVENVDLDETQIADISSLDTGALIKITGQLFEKKATSLIIGTGDETIKVTLKKFSGLLGKNYTKGDWLTVVGVVDQQNGKELRLLPRQIDDVSKGLVAGASEVFTSSTPTTTIEQISLEKSNHNQEKQKIIFSVVALTAIIIIWEFINWIRKQKIKK